MASLLGSAPKETVLWGVQPESVKMALELSAPVMAQLELLAGKVLQELAAWGVESVSSNLPAKVPPPLAEVG